MTSGKVGEATAARLAAFGRSFDARDLWPGVTPGGFRAAQETMAGAIAAVLGGAKGVDVAFPAGVDARTAGVAASAAGVGPLLGFWCSSRAVRMSPELTDLFADHLEHGRRRAERLRRELERALEALHERGIEVVLLKGMATGRRYFDEPALRVGADIDIMVRPEDFDATGETLGGLGFTGPRDARVQRATWDIPGPEDFGSLEMTHEDNPASIDVHTSLERGPVPGVRGTTIRPDLRDCRRVTFPDLSVPVRLLPPPLEVVFLALHTSYHFSTITLIRLVELAGAAFQLRWGVELTHDQVESGWRDVGALIRAYRLGRFVYPSLALVDQLAPRRVPADVVALARADAPPWLRSTVASLTPGSAQRLFPVPRLQGLRWARTPLELLRGAGDLVWPHGRDDRRAEAAELLRIYGGRVARAAGAIRRSLS